MYARITVNEATIITGRILKYRSHWKQQNHRNENLKGMATQEKDKNSLAAYINGVAVANTVYVRPFSFCKLGLDMARVIIRLSW